MTTERPILFSGAMVRALLDGSKTQTRRIVNPQPEECWMNPPRVQGGKVGDLYVCPDYLDPKSSVFVERTAPHTYRNMGSKVFAEAHCRHGLPGDRLWVREAFAVQTSVEHEEKPPHNDGRPLQKHDGIAGESDWWRQAHYKATDPAPELDYSEGDSSRPTCRECEDGEPHVHWRPSIHMPRWASRITLEITAVRVERLQEISTEDAYAEGIQNVFPEMQKQGLIGSQLAAKNAYEEIWESINGPGSWALNPWVWVIEFKRVQP